VRALLLERGEPGRRLEDRQQRGQHHGEQCDDEHELDEREARLCPGQGGDGAGYHVPVFDREMASG
jgi:hypothetical protein